MQTLAREAGQYGQYMKYFDRNQKIRERAAMMALDLPDGDMGVSTQRNTTQLGIGWKEIVRFVLRWTLLRNRLLN